MLHTYLLCLVRANQDNFPGASWWQKYHPSKSHNYALHTVLEIFWKYFIASFCLLLTVKLSVSTLVFRVDSLPTLTWR